MLNTVYKDAIINREKMLSILKGPKFEQILQKARANWNDFTTNILTNRQNHFKHNKNF